MTTCAWPSARPCTGPERNGPRSPTRESRSRSTTRSRGFASPSFHSRWGDSIRRSTSSASSPTSRPSRSRSPAQSFDAQGESADRIRQLEQELVYTKEHLQTTIEELEASNEELQSTNEELVASNEELQSTNEELHSVNEELYTVNAEYQKKIDELTQLTNDIDNLLHSTDIGTVFLDINLNIRKFTSAIAQVFNLLPMDIGRPLKHISNNIRLEHETLIDLIERMMSDGHMVVREVGGPGGETFLMRVFSLPDPGQRDLGHGLDVRRHHRHQAGRHQLEESQQLLKAILDNSRSTIFAKDLQGRYLFINRPFPTHERTPREELLGKTDVELFDPERGAGSCRGRSARCRHLSSLADRGDFPVRRRPPCLPDDQVSPSRRAAKDPRRGRDLHRHHCSETAARDRWRARPWCGVTRSWRCSRTSCEIRWGPILNANYLLLDRNHP